MPHSVAEVRALWRRTRRAARALARERARAFEIWRPGDASPTVTRTRLEWHRGRAARPFALDVRECFAEVYAE